MSSSLLGTVAIRFQFGRSVDLPVREPQNAAFWPTLVLGRYVVQVQHARSRARLWSRTRRSVNSLQESGEERNVDLPLSQANHSTPAFLFFTTDQGAAFSSSSTRLLSPAVSFSRPRGPR